jgi:hypothetical protein
MSKSLPTCYAVYYRKMSEKARDLGYGLALHGSLLRDADMIAVPWNDRAASPEELAQAMVEVTGGYLETVITQKPHGRIGRVIQLGSGTYIDLGIMPRQAPGEKGDE